MKADHRVCVDVILPLKLSVEISYLLPEGKEVEIGSWIVVKLRGKQYLAIVNRIWNCDESQLEKKLLEVEEIKTEIPKISQKQLSFWKTIADYYLCTIGEVFKSACPSYFFKQVEKKRSFRKATNSYVLQPVKTLSPEQEEAKKSIEAYFSANQHTVLLDAVTASGKTEIYISLAGKALEKGKSVLYLVPEIAISRQLEQRLGAVFSDQLFVWHSKQTPAARKATYDKIVAANKPYIMLGTRSALLLPHSNLGLVVVDEEHDGSYKQSDPAPRYHGRDLALLLAKMHNADTVLGSATPSLESLYNAQAGKYGYVKLTKRYFGESSVKTILIDMNKAYAVHDVKGSFSRRLLQLMSKTLEAKKQIMIFRSRRSYASWIQCPQCGYVPKCPKCDVSLSYHKLNNSLNCHYCGYSEKYEPLCPSCRNSELSLRGAGTEKLEEELKELFPQANVSRFDADITSSKTEEKRVLEGFNSGEINIIVGTQMLTKGFDFANLSLVAVINADSLTAQQDFRSDEKAVQLLHQLKGRAARRQDSGNFVIQTWQSNYPVFTSVIEDKYDFEALLTQRQQFAFPPYLRLMSITIKDRYEGRTWRASKEFKDRLSSIKGLEYMGPVAPVANKLQGFYSLMFWVKLPKKTSSAMIKSDIAKMAEDVKMFLKPAVEVIIDVDPF